MNSTRNIRDDGVQLVANATERGTLLPPDGFLVEQLDDNSLWAFNAQTASWVEISGSGGGTGSVTSVGLSLPLSTFTVTGSPVTTSGTLTGSLKSQTANTIFAGPTTGADAVPQFRAAVAADIPSLSSIYLPLAGGTMIGNLFLNGDPTVNTQAATKIYVDSLVNGLKWKDSCKAATVAALPTVTYNNGVGGVGATLTGTLPGAFPTIDGYTVLLNDRLCIQNQATQLQNGIYTLTQIGDVVTPFILTRSVDANDGTELVNATTNIVNGTINGGKGFTQQTSPCVIGTDSVVWVMAFTTVYTASGLGITLSGNLFSLQLDGSTLSQSITGLKVATGGLTNNEISASAAIARTKIAVGTANSVITNTAAGTLSSITGSDTQILQMVGTTPTFTNSTNFGYFSGSYISPNFWTGAFAGSVAGVLNKMFFYPVFIRKAITLDRIGITQVLSAAGSIRLGIYNDNNFYPGTRLLDAGVVTGTGAQSFNEITISQALTANTLYWICWVGNGGANTPTWTNSVCNNFLLGSSGGASTGVSQAPYITATTLGSFAALPAAAPVGATLGNGTNVPAFPIVRVV